MRLFQRPSHLPSATQAPWRVHPVRFALGAASMASGFALSGLAMDRAWSLALQQALGSWPVAWGLLTWSALGACALLMVASLSAEEPRRVAALLVAMVLGGLVVHALKRTLQVERPLAVFGPDHPVFRVIGEQLRMGSMPSGHTTTAFTVAGLMTLGLRPLWASPGHRIAAVCMACAWWCLAALQGVSRVVVGAHWPSDVLAGAGVGLCLAPLVWHLGLTQRLGQRLAQHEARPWVAGILPVWAVLLCLLDLGTPLPTAWCAAVVGLGLLGAWRWGRTAPGPQPLS